MHAGLSVNHDVHYIRRPKGREGQARSVPALRTYLAKGTVTLIDEEKKLA